MTDTNLHQSLDYRLVNSDTSIDKTVNVQKYTSTDSNL